MGIGPINKPTTNSVVKPYSQPVSTPDRSQSQWRYFAPQLREKQPLPVRGYTLVDLLEHKLAALPQSCSRSPHTPTLLSSLSKIHSSIRNQECQVKTPTNEGLTYMFRKSGGMCHLYYSQIKEGNHQQIV